MTLIKLNTAIKTLKGEPMTSFRTVVIEDLTTESGLKEDEKGIVKEFKILDSRDALTIGSVISEAILTEVDGDKITNKAKRYAMAIRWSNLEEIEITPEEITLIEKHLEPFSSRFMAGALIYGQIMQILKS